MRSMTKWLVKRCALFRARRVAVPNVNDMPSWPAFFAPASPFFLISPFQARSGVRAAFRVGSTEAVAGVAGVAGVAAMAVAVGATRRARVKVAEAGAAAGAADAVGVATPLGLPARPAAPSTCRHPWQQLHRLFDEPRRPSRNIPTKITNTSSPLSNGVCEYVPQARRPSSAIHVKAPSGRDLAFSWKPGDSALELRQQPDGN